MSDIDNGGPAFPRSERDDGVPATHYFGMTLRDYFAAHAPIDMAEARNYFYQRTSSNPSFLEAVEMLSELRLKYADAMLKARKS